MWMVLPKLGKQYVDSVRQADYRRYTIMQEIAAQLHSLTRLWYLCREELWKNVASIKHTPSIYNCLISDQVIDSCLLTHRMTELSCEVNTRNNRKDTQISTETEKKSSKYGSHGGRENISKSIEMEWMPSRNLITISAKYTSRTNKFPWENSLLHFWCPHTITTGDLDLFECLLRSVAHSFALPWPSTATFTMHDYQP